MKLHKISVLQLIGIVCLVSNYLSCTSSTQPMPRPHGIILISLDTLRADHLGCYGYHRDTSPCIDAFAKENVLFEKTVVQSPYTLPSHMSIMTSLYPSSHGVYNKNTRLAEENVTLAELLHDVGYQTAAFVDGGYMNALFGFNQGFDVYDDWGGSIEQVEEVGKGIAHILPKAKKWLNKNKAKPFFLFIHCYDIHSPYAPPPPYDNIFHDFVYTGKLEPSTETLIQVAWKGMKTTDEDVRHFMALYDGGIRYTDKQIGDFLLYLKEIDLYDPSLIIITSDHGEEFKEHGSFLHWQLYYRPNLHVPLIIHLPNNAARGARINELVQSVDLLPTLLDITGIPPLPMAEGKSLVPVIERNKDFMSYFLGINYYASKEEAYNGFAEDLNPRDWSIISDDYQMIYFLKSKSTQLFNIKADPLAQKDIAKDNKHIIEELLAKYKQDYNLKSHYKPSPITLDEQTQNELKALGYVQ